MVVALRSFLLVLVSGPGGELEGEFPLVGLGDYISVMVGGT